MLYERVLALGFSDELKKLLKDLGVDQTIILGVSTLESAGFVPDSMTGGLRRVGLALILLAQRFSVVLR